MSTGTGNSRDFFFSLYNVSPVSWVLSEAEAPFLLKEENQGLCLGFFFLKEISGFFDIRLLFRKYGKVRKTFLFYLRNPTCKCSLSRLKSFR